MMSASVTPAAKPAPMRRMSDSLPSCEDGARRMQHHLHDRGFKTVMLDGLSGSSTSARKCPGTEP